MADLSELGRRLADAPPLPPRSRGDLQKLWRRRQTRRLALAGVGLAAITAVIAGVLLSRPGSTRVHVIAPPAGPVQPVRPTTMAVSADGGLFIADPALNEILERQKDGRFTVVAGNGRAGFSGDGAPATGASLDDPGGMAFGPDGTLYFADQGNHRVRAVGPDGVIRTAAGGGTSGRSGFVRRGTPALSASFNPTAVAFGAGNRLYIATGEEVVRIEADGTLTPVAGKPGPSQGLVGIGGPALDASADGVNGLAFDAAGYLYLAGSNTKSLLAVRPDGMLALVTNGFYPRGSGGLVAAPDGSVLAMDTQSVESITPSATRQVISFEDRPFHGVPGFSPNGIAVGADGTIYIDTFLGNGYANRSAIAAVSPTGTSSSLLWEQGAQPSPRPPPQPGTLHGDGIGTTAFGAAQSEAVADLRRLLGQPGATRNSGAPACGVDTTVQWAGLDAYFLDGRFVGYSAQSTTLPTEAGLRVGDALSFAQQLYGSAVVTSMEQGGAWFLATPSGVLIGYLTAEPNTPGAVARIATIEAGDVGCHAQTP